MDKAGLAKNTAVQSIGKMLGNIFGILAVAILSRYLAPEGYGQLTIVLTFLSVFAAIVDFGLTLTTVQMISDEHEKENEILGNLLTLRIVSAVLFLSLAPVCAFFFPYEQVIILGIAVGAISYLFGTTSQMLIGVFQKRLVMHRAVIAELLNRSLVLVGAYLAMRFDWGLIGIMWLFVFGNALQLGTIILLARNHVKIRFRFHSGTMREIISRSWPIGASIFFNLIYLRGDIIFLSLFRGDAEVGLYGAAYKVVDVITTIPVMYMGLALPMLVRAFSKDKTEFQKIMQDSFNFLAILAVPFALGSIALGRPVMELISGSQYSESGAVLMILGPAASIVFLNSLFGHAVVAVKKQKIMTLGYLFVAVLTVLGYLIFIPQYGMWAAAWWTLIAETLIGLITFFCIVRTGKFIPQLASLSRAILAGLFMFIVLKLLPDINVIFSILIGIFVYFVALASIGGPKIKDIRNLFLPEKPPLALP
ncbi:MAG: flippase [Patescibacteria group bacterium]|jgi:O-antigen/teichoic acid export membrane protein